MKWPNKNRSSRFVQLQNRHFNWRFAILIFFFINWNSCKPSFHIAVYLRFLNKSAISTSGPVICKKKIFPNLSYVDGIVGNIFPINAKWKLVCFWAILWKKTRRKWVEKSKGNENRTLDLRNKPKIQFSYLSIEKSSMFDFISPNPKTPN